MQNWGLVKSYGTVLPLFIANSQKYFEKHDEAEL